MTATSGTYLNLCLLLLHGFVEGLQVAEHGGKLGHLSFAKKACVSILVTKLEIYQGMELTYLITDILLM